MRRMKPFTMLLVGSIGLAVVGFSALLYDTIPRLRIKKISSHIGPSTQVQLYRLHGRADEFDGGVFFQGYERGNFGTYGSAELERADIAALKSLLSAWKMSPNGTALCHTPQYGVRLIQNGRVVEEFTMSWNCLNIAYETRFFGVFYAQRQPEGRGYEELLYRFNEILPYNENFLEEQKRRMEEFFESLNG